MKHNHNYEINYIEGKIIATKSFLKEAGVIGSTAYTELAQVRMTILNSRLSSVRSAKSKARNPTVA